MDANPSAQTILDRGERHPDIFDDAQASEYLQLHSDRSMDTVAKKYRILPLDLPGARKWHRADLDSVVAKSRAQSAKRGRGSNTQLKIGADES